MSVLYQVSHIKGNSARAAAISLTPAVKYHVLKAAGNREPTEAVFSLKLLLKMVK